MLLQKLKIKEPLFNYSITIVGGPRNLKDWETLKLNRFKVDIEVNSDVKRIINVYRCFNPQEEISPREKFKYQLGLIKNAMTTKTVILGDFNIDYEKIYDDNYAHKNLFDDLESELSCFNIKFHFDYSLIGL